MQLRYPVVKLLDYREQEAELESHRHPFAVVTLVHLKDEQKRVMQYVTSVERIGIKKGLQQGESRVLRRLLTRRFGELLIWAEAKLQEAALEQLEAWSERVLEAGSLEEVFGTDVEH